MNSLRHWLDILFPPRDTSVCIRDCSYTAWQATYQPSTLAHTTYLSTYHDPLVRAAITELKFHYNLAAAKLLASHLNRWITAQSMQGAYFVPIPLSRPRYRERGHNQVMTVLRHVPTRVRAKDGLLVRTLDTPPQTSLAREQRLTNVQQAFTVRPHELATLPPDAHIVLLDDVVTTGATMAAAKAELSPHLLPTQSLTCLALAH